MTTLWLLRTPDDDPPPLSPGDEVAIIDGNDRLVELLAAHPRVAVWGAPTRTLDLTGEVCPFTFVRAKLALEDMAAGERLLIVVDHEPATRNVPRSAAAWGQRVVGVAAAGPGRWRIVLERVA
jgi:tRNA 2-thiouridine synthesizing protein A